jgi:membrane protein YqaA with SNARE-associated domain
MESWAQVSGAALYIACFGLSIVSALVPWVNGEALLLSCAVLAPSPLATVGLVGLASVGQMVGKCVLYWGGSSLKFHKGRAAQLTESWKRRLSKSPSRALAVVFLSSTVGIPPFYLITLLAGALKIRFAPFIGIGLCGRVVRFGLLVLTSNIAIHLSTR